MKITHLHLHLLKSVFSSYYIYFYGTVKKLDIYCKPWLYWRWTQDPFSPIKNHDATFYLPLFDIYNISISISIRSKPIVSSSPMTSPLIDAQWKTATPCNSFLLTYPRKKKKTGGMEWIMPHIFICHCTFPERQFHVGLFCLLRNEGLDGVPPEECTQDRYWKARIIEIRRPRRKSNATCNPVSGEISHNVLPHPIYIISGTLSTHAMVLQHRWH